MHCTLHGAKRCKKVQAMNLTTLFTRPIAFRQGSDTQVTPLTPIIVSPNKAAEPRLDELVERQALEVQPEAENAVQGQMAPFVVLSTGLILAYDKSLACYVPAKENDLQEYRRSKKQQEDIAALQEAIEADEIKAHAEAREKARKEVEAYLQAFRFVAFLACIAIVAVLTFALCKVVFIYFLPAVATGATVAGEMVGKVVAWLAGAAVISFVAVWVLSGLFSSLRKEPEQPTAGSVDATNNITIIQNLASSKAQNLVQ